MLAMRCVPSFRFFLKIIEFENAECSRLPTRHPSAYLGGSNTHPSPQGPDDRDYFFFGFFGFGFSGAEGKAAWASWAMISAFFSLVSSDESNDRW